MKILMVCLGNICRSPLADALLRNKIKEQKLDWIVDSAGTSGLHSGGKPDLRTMQNAERHGIKMDFLRSRQFIREDFDQFDMILTMDQSNFKNVIALADNEQQKAKVYPILKYVQHPEITEVPDPYYGGDGGFQLVFELLDDATNKILQKHLPV
jgi:protein-tyrosine phosphatase